MPAVTVKLAPYADIPIELSLQSVTSKTYKTYYCVECQHPFLQRDSGTIYRINTDNEPAKLLSDASGTILTRCGRCSQKYTGYVAFSVNRWLAPGMDEPLAYTAQSLCLQPSATKEERYIRCLDCGYTFCTLLDRIAKIIDNSLPIEYMPPSKVSAVLYRCKAQRCRQRWSIMV